MNYNFIGLVFKKIKLRTKIKQNVRNLT